MLRIGNITTFIPGLLCLLFTSSLLGQTTTVRGLVRDDRTNETLPNVTVYFMLSSVLSDEDGYFELETPQVEQDVYVTFEKSGYQSKIVHFQLSGQEGINIGAIPLLPQEDLDQLNAEDFIPTIGREAGEVAFQGDESIAGLLTATRDNFVSTAAYHFGAARFNLRGYDSRNTEVLLNGVPVNHPGDGFYYWNNWGGLNDVLRDRTNNVGLGTASFAFGGMGGATMVDTRASRQRRQIRASYAYSNRLYNHRMMATLSSGALPGGWAVSLSGSRRMADEGFIPGTFYDAWSYMGSVSKLLGDRHELNLTVLGSPLMQGRNEATTEEMLDLAGTNFYNPSWGYQDERKRNARVQEVHQPMAILRHDMKFGNSSTLTTSVAYQLGRNGTTGLEWYDASDPRPDYFRKLPSFVGPEQAPGVDQEYRNDENVRQIDWAYLYDVNRHNIQTINDVNGIPGNNFTGRRAQYILQETRNDSRRLVFNTNLHGVVSHRFTFDGGLSYQVYQGDHFKMVNDLLDADFYLDIDKFSEFDHPTDEQIIQNDLSRPNRLVAEGDTFGYSYQTNLNRAAAWVQLDFTLGILDFFLAGNASQTNQWREGNWTNGRFPNNSKGESEKQEALNYGGKAGFALKFNKGNYFLVNGAYQTRAPFLSDTYIGPGVRDLAVGNLEGEEIYGGEVSFVHRSTRFRARLTGFYTLFNNQLSNRSLYMDSPYREGEAIIPAGIAHYVMSGANTEHLGGEVSGDLTVLPGFRVSAAAAIGQYTYTNDPMMQVYLDHEAEPLREYTTLIKDFHIPNTPQTAVNAGIHYHSNQFWFVSLNANYFRDIWIDFNPDRRSEEALTDAQTGEMIPVGSALYNQITQQQKAPEALTLDFFGGVSWKIGEVVFYLNLGVNNILDKTDFINGGAEQYRFDFEGKNVDLFPSRNFYGLGRTYFVQLGLKI